MSLSFLQFAGELRKLFTRRRTWLGFAAFVIVELLMAMFIEFESVKEVLRVVITGQGRSFEQYFSGLTVAFLIMDTTVLFGGALFVAMVAGDVVAKEVEDGTLRMLLCRPVSRLRILTLKFLATSLYTFLLVFFIGLTALAVGLAVEGRGDLFAFAPLAPFRAFHPFRAGLVQYLISLPLFALSLLTVNAVAFLFSCLNLKPATATIGTAAIFFFDLVFRSHPFFQSIASVFITRRLSVWLEIFRPEARWPAMAEQYVWLFALDATLFVVAWLNFEQRDFKT
ncbi:MAG: type transport system permease protein [Chthoniobacter sp.]|jgi:ABC-2 type transport system permease protein|nr:type transport system permease protein [Chthoniobacter sp.]